MAYSIFIKPDRNSNKLSLLTSPEYAIIEMIGKYGFYVAISFLLSCGPHAPSRVASVEQVVECFLNPAFCSLVSQKTIIISLKQWDSLVHQAIHARALTPGIFTTVLKDSLNVDYTLGYTTPSTLRTDTTYPLIIYLHGGTGSTLSTKGEKAWDMLRPMADTFNLFLASPSANRYTPWWSPAGIGRILQTLRYMTLHYPINPDKVFLAGVSDGATGCYAAANSIPSPFAGFIAVSGYGGMLPAVGIPLVPSNIMQRPIYNINAGKDRIYDINRVNKFLDWLEQQGARVQRKEYPEELHGFDYRDREFGTIAHYIRTWSRPTDKSQLNWSIVEGLPNCADNLLGFIPDDAGGNRNINGFWKNNTLHIASEGLREAVVNFPGVDKETITVCINKKRPRRIRAMPIDARLSYRLMMHACFPLGPNFPCYRIQF
jgi:acetyl esterase/lipase